MVLDKGLGLHQAEDLMEAAPYIDIIKLGWGTSRLFSEKTGFTVSKIISLPPDVFYISALSERYRESKFPFISGFVKGMGFLLRSLFKTAGSSSLIYILKKRS